MLRDEIRLISTYTAYLRKMYIPLIVSFGAVLLCFFLSGHANAAAPGREELPQSFSSLSFGSYSVEPPSPPPSLHLDYPAKALVAGNGEQTIIFRATPGYEVQLKDGDDILWSGPGNGTQPVSFALPELETGEVHLLKLALTTEETTLEQPLPPIVIRDGETFDISLAAKLGARIASETSWDFNGDGVSGSDAEKADDFRALLGLLDAAAVELPEYDNAMTAFSLWNGSTEYEGTIQGQTISVNVPSGTDLSALDYAASATDESVVEPPGESIDYADHPAVFRVVSPLGEETLYYVYVYVDVLSDSALQLWTPSEGSLWHVYLSSQHVKNQAAGYMVTLPPDDTSDGYLPISPFSGESLWYGKSVSEDVYEIGNYINDVAAYHSLSDGGPSTQAHFGTIVSPVISVPDTPDPKLSFWSWWEIEGASPSNYDRMEVLLYDGIAENSLLVLNLEATGGGSGYLAHTSSGYNQAAVWKKYEVSLANYKGQDGVQIQLRFSTIDTNYNGFRGWFVDQVFVGSNSAPTLTGAAIAGSPAVGQTLTAVAAGYADADTDAEAASKYVWYVSDAADGPLTRVAGTQTNQVVVSPDWEGKYITVDVYPYDGKEYGEAARAAPVFVPGAGASP